MQSPGSCSRCNRALPAGSDAGLCLACRRAAVVGVPARAAAAVGATADLPDSALADTRTVDLGANRDFSPDPDRFRPEAPPGYELVRWLGGGGMGTVYLARELAAERTVAMKLLNAPGSPAAFERFLVEARALARLDHPNIIKVVAVETNWREPYFTMEYADGGSLADLTEPGKLPPPAEAARLVLAAADAVAAAHAAGILHRDIKPSNILLAEKSEIRNSKSERPPGLASLAGFGFRISDLTPKVSDFGLAKRTDRDDGLTRTGPIGTPRYMSPEAAAGRFQDVGPPADVYGLGATLYHLLTGRPPFEGECQDEVLRKVLRDPLVRPRAVRPDLSADLEAVVVKALEKDPAQRYPTAAALAADLRRFLAGEPPAAPVLSRSRRAGRWLGRYRRRLAAAVGVAVLAVVLVGAGWYFRPEPVVVEPEQQIRDEIAAGKVAHLLGPDGRPRAPAWPLGPEEVEPTPADGGTVAFGSSATRILLLLTDPGVDSYRVEADLWQVQKYGNALPTADKTTNEVGLVLGYANQAGADGTRVHTLMVLGFTDFDPAEGPGTRHDLLLADVGLVVGPGLTPGFVPTVRGVPGQPLRPNPGGPGWRRVGITVTPEGVWVPGRDGRPVLADTAGIAERRVGPRPFKAESLRDWLAKTAGPVALPDWSPRMPVGIWCNGSWVMVRNVTVQAIK